MKTLFSTTLSLVLTFAATAQGVKIGTNNNNPDASAALEVESTTKGLLPPRLTIAERDAISNPANGLLIYNTTTRCYEGYDGVSASWLAFGCICPLPTAVSASASPNPVCEGSTLSLTGSATGATAWSWTGPNGFTSSVQNPTIPTISALGGGVYTLVAANECGSAAPATTQVVLTPAPTTANAGVDQDNLPCGITTTTTLTANTPVVGSGSWSVVSGAATITNPSSPTSNVTGLAIYGGTAVLRWTISNGSCSSYDDVAITTCDFPNCGTVTDADNNTYNTVLIGSQCWMRENLKTGTFISVGTAQTNNGTIEKYCQNLSGSADATCPLGGLYQWNEMMNYTAGCNGSGAPPNDKCSTPVKGICPTGWHIPSHYEWTTLEKNVGSNPSAFNYDTSDTGWFGTDEGGNLKATSSWNSPNTGATNSSGFTALPAGYSGSGSFFSAGNDGHWWSSTEGGSGAWRRNLSISSAQAGRYKDVKSYGFAARCLRD